MDDAERQLNDHRLIRTQDGLFTASMALVEHQHSRRWLERELGKPFGGKTVLITHHGPHPLSVHPRYAGDPANAAFVTDLSALLSDAKLWLHGHVHDSFDYMVGGCRVMTNPLGYAHNRRQATKAKEFNAGKLATGFDALYDWSNI